MRWPAAADEAARAMVLIFLVLVSVYAIRNNDIWWHMAIGKRLLETGRWLTQDPFLFSVPGIAWQPHAWLSEVLFYGVYAVFSPVGLVICRVLLVGTSFFFLFRQLRRRRVSLALASPVVLLALLIAHSRFVVRPHLFEYLMVVLLLGWLLADRERRGLRLFVVPVALQIAWVNLHASFYLGPVLVFLFFAGEWLQSRLPFLGDGLVRSPLPLRRLVLLLLLMGVASFVTPSPLEMVLQPLQGEHRELMTRYTLEWRSPFDPAIRNAAFHPYYEVLLAMAVAAFLLAGRRLKLSALFLVGFFVFLSVQAHRFRVEFALVAVPLVLVQLGVSPLILSARGRLASRGRILAVAPFGAAIVISLFMMWGARDLITVEGAVSDRYPTGAYDFVRRHDIANRPFQTIGFGSYLVWYLYPDRQAFIDGRNLSAALHLDYVACQANIDGFNSVIDKHRLDSFVLPAPDRSDAGVLRIHRFLIRSEPWALVYIDPRAYVYVKRATVSRSWLDQHAYRVYHPLTFARQSTLPEPIEVVSAELERAQREAPDYGRVFLDSARFYAATGRIEQAAAAVDHALALDPTSREALSVRKTLDSLR